MLDVVCLEEAKQLMALAEAKAPLAGIFQLAMMLDDRLIAQQVQQTSTTPLHLCAVLELHAKQLMAWQSASAQSRHPVAATVQHECPIVRRWHS